MSKNSGEFGDLPLLEIPKDGGSERLRNQRLIDRAKDAGILLLAGLLVSAIPEGSPTRKFVEQIPVIAAGGELVDGALESGQRLVPERSIQRDLANNTLFYDQSAQPELSPGPHDAPPELVELQMQWPPSNGPDWAHKAQYEHSEILRVDPDRPDLLP